MIEPSPARSVHAAVVEHVPRVNEVAAKRHEPRQSGPHLQERPVLGRFRPVIGPNLNGRKPLRSEAENPAEADPDTTGASRAAWAGSRRGRSLFPRKVSLFLRC